MSTAPAARAPRQRRQRAAPPQLPTEAPPAPRRTPSPVFGLIEVAPLLITHSGREIGRAFGLGPAARRVAEAAFAALWLRIDLEAGHAS